MIEEAAGEPPDPDRVPGGWRSRLKEWARCMRAAGDRHPWLPGAAAGEPIMGPNETGWIECAAALADTGLDGSERMDTVAALSAHIRGTQSAGAAGTQPWAADRQRELLLAHADRYAAVASAAVSPVRDTSREFGLTRILDGLRLLIAERSSPPPPGPLPGALPALLAIPVGPPLRATDESAAG